MLKNKYVTTLLSLVLALILWMYVIEDTNPTMTRTIGDVPIQLLGMEDIGEDSLALLSIENTTLNITIEGKRADASNVTAENINVTADLRGYEAGEQHIPISITVPNTVTLASQSLTTVTIVLEELISEEKPIQIFFSGDIKEDTEPTLFSSEPKNVTVSGARSKVEAAVAANGYIDVAILTDQTSDINVPLSPVDSDGNVISDLTLSSENVRATAAALVVKEVPISLEVLGNTSIRYEINEWDIEEVQIKGTAANLDEIEELVATPVDVTDITESTTIDLELELPEGVALSNTSPRPEVYINVEEVAVEEATISKDMFIVSGVEEGFDVEFAFDEVDVIVAGPEEELEEMENQYIRVSVDLSGLEEGTHTVPIDAYYEGDLLQVETKTKGIGITITRSIV